MRLQIPFLTMFLLAPALTAQTPPVANAKLETASAAAGLEAAVNQAGSRGQDPVWVAWTVPMIPKERFLCCLDQLGRKKWTQTTCHLEGKNQSWGGTNDVKVPADQDLLVLVRLSDRQVDKVRSYSAACSVDADGRRLVWLGNVKPEESVALIAKVARRRDDQAKPGEEALAALSHHRNARADEALEEMASAPHSRKLREEALFWIGQNRGERGARFLGRVIDADPDGDIREKAIFSLSQNEAPGAADAIIRASREDRSTEVRGEALFWLAQMNDPRSPDAILQAIDRDPDLEVKKKGVFALSQLDKGRGIPLLVRLGREGRPREIRKEALFWLAQSDDPAALEYLDKVLNE